MHGAAQLGIFAHCSEARGLRTETGRLWTGSSGPSRPIWASSLTIAAPFHHMRRLSPLQFSTNLSCLMVWRPQRGLRSAAQAQEQQASLLAYRRRVLIGLLQLMGVGAHTSWC
jgi:hypothetical protein